MDAAITHERPAVVGLLLRRGYDIAADGRRLLEKARRRPGREDSPGGGARPQMKHAATVESTVPRKKTTWNCQI